MTDVTFEKIDTSVSGGQDVGYVMILLLLLGGVLLALSVSGPVALAAGTGLIIIAVLSFVRLLRKTPTLRYFPYFWLDQEGVHHIEGNSPTGRTAHFTWDEIQTAEASAWGDDFKGLILTLKRQGMQGVPIFLTMENAEEGAIAIKETIDSRPHRARSVKHSIFFERSSKALPSSTHTRHKSNAVSSRE